MRTLIDLKPDQLAALDELRAQRKVSRAELVREAVTEYLAHQTPVLLKDRPGFGAWAGLKEDGVEIQRRLRAEWKP